MSNTSNLVGAGSLGRANGLERWVRILEIAPGHALVEAIVIKPKTAGGIIIPDMVKSGKPSFFRLLILGPEFTDHPHTKGLEVGDVIIPHTGYPFNVDGKMVQIIENKVVIGRVPKARWE